MSFWYRNGVCSNNRPSKRRENVTRHYGCGAFFVVCTASAVAYAQDSVPPGMQARMDITQRLESSDNPDLDVNGSPDTFGRTVLGFGLSSIRTVDSFFLDLGADIEEGRSGRDSVDLTNYSSSLAYTRDTRNARAVTTFRFQEADANQGVLDDEFDENGNVINQTSGTRQSLTLGFEGELGREAPIGASIQGRYNLIDFSGTTSDSQRDSDTARLSGQINFEITPRITTSLTSTYEDFNATGGGVDRETIGFGSAARLFVGSVDTIDVAFSFDSIQRSGDETGSDEGISGNLGWSRDLPNGAFGLNYASDVSSNADGRRSFLSLERRIDLPRGGLSFTLGVTGTETVGSDPLVELDYTHRMPTSVITVGLSQRVAVDNNNEEEINTRLRASFTQDINATSNLGLRLSYFNRNELQMDANDGERLDISLTYRHDLTADWGLVSGFTHRFSTEDTGEDRRSNTVFVGLERNFSWIP